MAEIICSSCSEPYPSSGAPYRCPSCGGLLDITGSLKFDPQLIENSLPGLWRYRHTLLCLPDEANMVSLGEGGTPLVWDEWHGRKVGLKMESLNPTGSYKDRGSAVLTVFLQSRGIIDAVEDSSGNAGASFAAYAARAGIRARIFVPESASGPKRLQIEQYGAELVRIPGPRSEAARAVQEEVATGKVYASHAYMPFGLPGIATIAYELWETLGSAPGTIITPAGHGGLLRGIVMGFHALHKAGLIPKPPYTIGVQAAECAPLAAAFEHGITAINDIQEGRTVAEGVRVRNPSQAQALLRDIPKENGKILAIAEDQILPACKRLASRGFYVEPTSALVLCALDQCIDQLPEPIIMIMTGCGLKYYPTDLH